MLRYILFLLLFLLLQLDNVHAIASNENALVSKKSKPKYPKKEKFASKKQSKKQQTTHPLGVEVFGGINSIQGDLPSSIGLSFGAGIRKNIGGVVGFKLQYNYAQNSGQDIYKQTPSQFQNNGLYNGKVDPSINYFAAGKSIFNNFQTTSHLINGQIYFGLNNLRFSQKEISWNYYLSINTGIQFFDSRVNQLNGTVLYDYNKVNDIQTGANQSDVKTHVKSILDNDAETKIASNAQLGSLNYAFFIGPGFGIERKISSRISIFAEAKYLFTNTKYLDGTAYSSDGSISQTNDGQAFVHVGICLSLAKNEVSSWFENPVFINTDQMDDSKKKVEIYKQLRESNSFNQAKFDSIYSMMKILTSDMDEDGVSDFFDKEPNTVKGSIVDGAGRSIFVRDIDNNLSFKDPEQNLDSNDYDPVGTNYSKKENGSKVKQYPDGRMYEKAPDGTLSQTTQDGEKFEKTPKGKTFKVEKDGAKKEFNLDEPQEKEAISYIDNFGNSIKEYPSGLRYKITKDGIIYKTYPDGTTYKKVPDGKISLVGNDVSNVEEVDFFEKEPKGTKLSSDEEGTKYKLFPNGIKFKTTKDGTIFKTYPDGETYMRAKSGEVMKIVTDNPNKEKLLDFKEPYINPQPKNTNSVLNSQFQNSKESNSVNNSEVRIDRVIQESYLPAIFFESDKVFIDQKYYPEVYMVSDIMKKNPGIAIKIIGHTDSKASADYNKNLGMQRARNVYEILTNFFGVSPNRLSIETRGAENPIVKSNSSEAMAANRRVQFEIVKHSGTEKSNEPKRTLEQK